MARRSAMNLRMPRFDSFARFVEPIADEVRFA